MLADGNGGTAWVYVKDIDRLRDVDQADIRLFGVELIVTISDLVGFFTGR